MAKLYPCDYSCRSVKLFFSIPSFIWWANFRCEARFRDGVGYELSEKRKKMKVWVVGRIRFGVFTLGVLNCENFIYTHIFFSLIFVCVENGMAKQTLNMIISKYDRLIQFSFSTTTLVHLICEKIKRPRRQRAYWKKSTSQTDENKGVEGSGRGEIE